MTDLTDLTERGDLLDFPGADELIAAGTVAPPTDDKIMAVREIVALIAARESEQALTATAHANMTPLGAARRGGPTAALAPPEDPMTGLDGLDGLDGLTGEPMVVLAPGGPESAPRRRRLSRRGRVLVAVAAVAAVAAGATVYPVLDMGGKPPSAASAATQFLNHMADVSNETPVTHGKYWMVNLWAKDGRYTALYTVYNDGSRFTWTRAANGKLVRSGHNIADWNVGDRRMPWTEFGQLPTDPEKLKSYFPTNPQERIDQIMALLAESPASPALRAALFQIVAKSPNVTMTPGAKDSHGRPGTEIVVHVRFSQVSPKAPPGSKPTTYDYYNRYIIDPKTSRILEGGAAGPHPAVSTTYLKVGWTNHIG
jgi:hypothetical protein